MPFKTYLINKVKRERFRLNGVLPSSRLPRKEKLCQAFRDRKVLEADQLPPKVDLRPEMTPVEDQSKIGSCTANALAGAYEYLTKKATGRETDFSRLFIYYNARTRRKNGGTVEDSGCSMTDAIEALEEFGTCLEAVWSYDISQKNTRPDERAYEQAQNFQIEEALQVDIDLDEMKSCLAQGFPFAFGLKLYTSFDKAEKTGIVPMPDVWGANRKSHGSHALLAVGYSDESQAFIVRNSWGEQWGDKGYCYIPYGYLTNADLCFDVWSIRKVENDDLGHENWQYNDDVNYRSGEGKDSTEDVDNAADKDDTDDNFAIEEVQEDDDEDEESKSGTFWFESRSDCSSSSHSYSYTRVQHTKFSSSGSRPFSHPFQNDEGNDPFERKPIAVLKDQRTHVFYVRRISKLWPWEKSLSQSDDILYLVGGFQDE